MLLSVEMIKKIQVEDLKPGMFVHDFNCGWMDHPFFQSQLLIKNDKAIEKILKSGIKELFIDTEKGDDVSYAPTAFEARRETDRRIFDKFKEKTDDLKKSFRITDVPYKEEIEHARGARRFHGYPPR